MIVEVVFFWEERWLFTRALRGKKKKTLQNPG